MIRVGRIDRLFWSQDSPADTREELGGCVACRLELVSPIIIKILAQQIETKLYLLETISYTRHCEVNAEPLRRCIYSLQSTLYIIIV